MKSKQKGGSQYTIQRVMGKINSSHIMDHDLVVVVNDIKKSNLKCSHRHRHRS